MIEVTVKTLDSHNHAFTVEDDITVAQFKEKIAETVNIPADTQRIIYCGRVLQDNSPLKDYDVNGKVVHLVHRPPPSLNQNANRVPSPQPSRRQFRGLERGNAMYLGSMAVPTGLLDSVPPLPTHSLAASRLNVARRMLRRAEVLLNILENPTSRSTEEPNAQEEPQEEVTPVFEARVIVPGNAAHEPIDEALVLSAVQSSLLNVGAVPLSSSQPIVMQEGSTSVEPLAHSTLIGMETPPRHSTSSTPEGVSPLGASSETLAAAGTESSPNNTASETGASSSGRTSDNVSRTTEYADLLDNLGRFQARFAPYLERYTTFMHEDPTVAQENYREMQAMINRVSEVLHYLGHAYHSLSDIIVRVRTPPPRPLLCRPILIQHSAIVQAGIPIQVEAQINISSDIMNNVSSSTSSTSQTTTTTTASNGQPAANTTNTSFSYSEPLLSNGNGQTITAHVQPTMLGIPLLSGPSMHLEAIPLEIRGLPRNFNVTLQRPGVMQNNNNVPNDNLSTSESQASSGISLSNTNSSTAGTAPCTTTGNSGATFTNATNVGSNITNNASRVAEGPFNVSGFNNPNVEFFMEVTPESITIDSLETALVGSNQANEFLRGALNGPPPELLQSIMQMAGHIINHGAPSTTTTPSSTDSTAPSAPPIESTTSDSQTSQSNLSGLPTGSMQNSQARGNTQTNPTTATNTRSTSRPHVHLAQHAMQGFDPFLPCNSHHVTPRRRFNISSTAQPQNSQNTATNQSNIENNEEPRGAHPFMNSVSQVMQGIVNSIRSFGQRSTQQVPSTASAGGIGATNIPSSATTPNLPPLFQFPPFSNLLQNLNMSEASPTIAQLLQQLPDESYVEGESILTDLIMMLSRNLTITDVIQLNGGRLEPLMRIRTQLRNFVLERVIDGSQNNIAIDRGVNRLIAEAQPFLDSLGDLDTRDDIDIVRSTQTLLRARLPNIISLAASRSPNSLRMLVEQCRTSLRQLCALTVLASRNGQQGVEIVFEQIVTRYMQGIPREIQQWTLLTSTVQLRHFITNLSVPDSILQPYIVRKVDAITPLDVDSTQQVEGDTSFSSEPMEVEEVEGNTSASELGIIDVNLRDDVEPLPAVVLGSESWHGQVPPDWVPIITRDSQRQRRQNSQPPFSDAYLSGMPSKRRKIVANSKPQGSLPQVITDSVRRAVTSTGLASVAPLEVVAQAAGADINIQSAYRDLLRSNVQSNLRNNEDFTPERFPNATNYFNNP